MRSRIRCSCGRVYDPLNHTRCPDCGAESALESVVVAEKVKPPIPPEPAPQILKILPWPVVAGAAVLLLGILFFALRRNAPTTQVSDKTERSSPAAKDGSSIGPGAGEASPALIPSGGTTIPSERAVVPSGGAIIPGGMPMGGVDLAALVANAASGATITVPAGVYPGGLVVTRAVHIMGDLRSGGQVMIQSEGKVALSVRAKGVTVQNIQFLCNGIGDLPAISVAEGADLEMDSCKVQSRSALGLLISGNATIKVFGSGFVATNGTAVRMDKQAHSSLTQCSFSDSKIGLRIADSATADLHACTFERFGVSDPDGAIMAVDGENTQVTGDDCHFTNNGVGISVSDKASLALTNCSFKDNTGSSARDNTGAGVVLVYRSAHATLRNTTLINSSPYAVIVMGGSTLTMEDTEISGSRTAGLIVGERNGPPAQAQVKRSHFKHNGTGIGVYAGGSADVQDSECRENNEGMVVMDQGSRLNLAKTSLSWNRDHGLYVYGNAEVRAVDSNFESNARGAQSGTLRKSSQRASLRLENCHFAGNRVFAAGACVQSELILSKCSFDGTDKTNIYRERGSIVQTDAGPGPDEAEPSPQTAAEHTGQNEDGSNPQARKKRKTDRHRPADDRREDDVSRLIRRFLPP